MHHFHIYSADKRFINPDSRYAVCIVFVVESSLLLRGDSIGKKYVACQGKVKNAPEGITG
jgi:hypothetical protein